MPYMYLGHYLYPLAEYKFQKGNIFYLVGFLFYVWLLKQSEIVLTELIKNAFMVILCELELYFKIRS